MRPLFLAFTLAGSLASALCAAAPNWQNISTDAGRRIELDRTTLKRTGNSVEILSRVTLERELLDAHTGTPYRMIEATTRYDCGSRNAKTIKRVYRLSDKEVLREELVSGAELPVRSGTLDDRVLREVCRPPKGDPLALAKAANEATGDLQAANAAMIQKAVAADQKTAAQKVSDAPGESIRPNLKAQAQAGQNAAPTPITPAPAPAASPASETPPEAAAEKQLPAVKAVPGATQYVRRNMPTGARVPVNRPASRAASASAPRPENAGGYMLEVVPASAQTAIQAANNRVAWGYEGAGSPENWARLDVRNSLCASGKRQAPIDLRNGIRVDLEPLRFDYRPSTFRIVDTGQTLSVAVGESSFSLTGKTYELEEIRFHRPSEIMVDGQRYAMDVHLLHRAGDGAQAIVALPVEAGGEHPLIQALWNNLPLEKNTPVAPPKTVIEPKQLLPGSPGYYTFMGSLTTPPCTEGVLWIVMKQPIQLSDEQIRIFSRLYRNNARPVQPLYDRLIKESR